MSLTFTLTGTESTLSADFFPAVELDSQFEYEIGLLAFESYNSIPNVDSTNNKFHYGEKGKSIAIPEGCYEVNALAQYLQQEMKLIDPKYFVSLTTNNNTLTTRLKCNFPVDLTPSDSIGRLLGLEPKKLKAGEMSKSAAVVDIFRVNTVQVECDIATGSFINGRPEHVLFQFFPSVASGFKIIEEPATVIYLPVTKRVIPRIAIRITDQDGRLVNFRGERITVRLHLRVVA